MARRVTKKKRAKKPLATAKRKKATKKPPANDLAELTLVSAVFVPDSK
jgi:hypothetical protein